MKRTESARAVFGVSVKKIDEHPVINAQAECTLIPLPGALAPHKTGQRFVNLKLLRIADTAFGVMVSECGRKRNASVGHWPADIAYNRLHFFAASAD